MNRRAELHRAAVWSVTAVISVAVAAGVGCGTASARPTTAPSDTGSPASTPQHTEPAGDTGHGHRRGDTSETSSPDKGTRSSGSRDADEEPKTEHADHSSADLDDPPSRQPADPPESEAHPAGHSSVPLATTDDGDTVKHAPTAETRRPNDPEHVAPMTVTLDSATLGTAAGEPHPNPAAKRPDAADSSESAEVATAAAVSTTAASAADTLAEVARREGRANPLADAAADAELESIAPPRYTGRPSVIQQVVVFVLRVVNAALEPFGGILAFTGLKVPVFADGVPPSFVTSGLTVTRGTIAGMPVRILTPPAPAGATVVALHGGAYVAEASLFHWETYADMARRTGATVIVPDYPLIGEPGGTADNVVPQTAQLITEVMTAHGAENTYVLGDSAGGALALAAVQLLVAGGAATPRRMVLLAPWLDATLGDPASEAVFDPLLNFSTLVRDGELWAGALGPAHPWASPINGSLAGLPPITVYSGSLDLLSPQTLRLRERAIAEGADITFVLRNGLMHDYPIFGFLPDAQTERSSIYRALLGEDAERLRAS